MRKEEDYIFCAEDAFEILPYGMCFMWASEKKYDQLIKLGYTERECRTPDREVFLINVDKKEFEIVDKHGVI